MVTVKVNIQVKPEHTDAFIAACKANAELTWHEPGNVRFDLFQQTDAPEHFVLIEVYDTAESQAAHLETDHFNTWFQATRDMIVSSSAKNMTALFEDKLK